MARYKGSGVEQQDGGVIKLPPTTSEAFLPPGGADKRLVQKIAARWLTRLESIRSTVAWISICEDKERSSGGIGGRV